MSTFSREEKEGGEREQKKKRVTSIEMTRRCEVTEWRRARSIDRRKDFLVACTVQYLQSIAQTS